MTNVKYDRAPIAEALINFGVVPQPGIELDQLAAVGVDDPGYPTQRENTTVEIEIHDEDAETTRRPLSKVFVSNDEKQVAQLRLDGLTFSRLAPYDHWEPFEEEALRWWARYAAFVPDPTLRQLVVRFINRLPIDQAEGLDLEDYWNVYPKFPDSLPSFSGYLMHVQYPLPQFQATGVLVQSIEPDPPGVGAFLILDNTVVRELDPAAGGLTETEVREALTDLREAKNFVFEACLTPKTRGMIS